MYEIIGYIMVHIFKTVVKNNGEKTKFWTFVMLLTWLYSLPYRRSLKCLCQIHMLWHCVAPLMIPRDMQMVHNTKFITWPKDLTYPIQVHWPQDFTHPVQLRWPGDWVTIDLTNNEIIIVECIKNIDRAWTRWVVIISLYELQYRMSFWTDVEHSLTSNGNGNS